MTGSLRRLDAFVKTRPDLQQKSAIGGIITLVAATTAAILFIGQIVTYVRGTAHHSLSLSRSVSAPLLPIPKEHESPSAHHALLMNLHGKIPLRLYVTFLHLDCRALEVTLDGASLSSGDLERIHGKHTLMLRRPTAIEMRKATGGAKSVSGGTGCTVDGLLRPQMVAGVLQITISTRWWQEASREIHSVREVNPEKIAESLQKYNVSHYIHKIEFGRTFSKSTVKPLEDRPHIIENEFGGVAIEQIQVKLIPTISQGLLFRESSYQTSVVDHTIQPQTLVSLGVQMLPGLALSYDFTPLTVHHSDGRDNVLVFLSSLVSIVAGVFVTVGLVTGCLVKSASAVAKKID